MNLRSTIGLVILTGAAAVYAALIAQRQLMSGSRQFDGVVGVLLGLFICSRPAANLLDALYRSGRFHPAGPGWWWPALNILAFAAGLIMIIIGTMQLTRAGAL